MRFPLLSKVLAVGLVMALMAMVLARIGWLVDERQGRRYEAVTSVKESVAAAQTVLGPILQRRCTEQWQRVWGEGKERRSEPERREFVLLAAPEALAVDGQLTSDTRYRGLYKVNGFSGRLVLDARWDDLLALQPKPEHPGSTLACEDATLYVAVSDPRGLRRAEIQIDGQARRAEPGTGNATHPQGLKAQLPAREAAESAPLVARLTIELAGTDRLALVPAAGSTKWALRSDWPHPSFGGRFLPERREISAQGFNAWWTVSSLGSDAARSVVLGAGAAHGSANRGAPGGVVCEPDAPVVRHAGAAAGKAVIAPCLDILSVAFFDPVNVLVLADRAIKYGMLFVVFTFMVVGLVEVLARRRVHPVQYGLVGLALCLFFLLLLGLSEHLAFDIAYAAASAACAGVLAMYATHMLGSRAAGLGFGAGVGALYGMLYVLLQQEQAALVIGSIALFLALAAVMWLTRRVDWYARFDNVRRPASMAG